MITSITFGSSSLFREEVRNKKLLNSIYMEWEKTNLFRCFMLSASSSLPDLLVKEIKDRLNKLEISKDDFERMKKVWIANEVKMADYIDNTVKNVYDDMINYGKVISNRIDLIRSLDLKKLNKIISEIDFNNTSVVVMLPKSIKKTSNN